MYAMEKKKVFVGIDVGTQGIRLVFVDEVGQEQFSASRKFDLTDENRTRQDPERWWSLLNILFAEAKLALGESFYNEYQIASIGVTSTSGTIIPLDRENKVLYRAIMYSDNRSQKQGEQASVVAASYYQDLPRFTNFNSSCGLAKMCWFKEEFAALFNKELSRFIHASDFMTGRMTGVYDITDHSNVLKSGYDLHSEEWPPFIEDQLGINLSLLPKVVPIGTVLGKLDAALASDWGLQGSLNVCVGLTDGCASQIAAGAVRLGDWNTTIGTTLVLKGVTDVVLYDEAGSIYCHKHPEGYWMPGGASNIGADWVHDFSSEEVAAGSVFDAQLEPSPLLYYPLKVKGERFPFISKTAEAFVEGDQNNRGALFQAGLEGVGFIERYAYEKIEQLSGRKVERIYAAGGANGNEKWLKIRACILNKAILRSDNANGAMGAAVVAAIHGFSGGLTEAADSLIGHMYTVLPDAALAAKYEDRYQEFIKLLKEKGFLNE